MESQKAKSRKEEMMSRDAMHRVSTIVRVFLLFLFSLSSANLSAQIKPFEDYSKCKIGFRGTWNDTLFPAKFEAAIPFTSSDDNYRNYRAERFDYLVSEKGKWGWLNPDGKWLLEPKYDALKFESRLNLVIAKLNGKCGAFAIDGSPGIPLVYDTIQNSLIIAPFDLQVTLNHHIGFCARNGKELIPPNYVNIEPHFYKIDSLTWGTDFFCFTDKEMHTYDTAGKIMFTKPFVRLSDFAPGMDRRRLNYLFLTETATGEFTVMDPKGKVYLPLSKFPYRPVYTMQAYLDRKTVNFAREENWNERYDEVSSRLTSMSTGKQSQWYKEIQFVKDRIYAHDDDRWYLLDTNFNILYEQKYIHEQFVFCDYYGEPTEYLPGDGDLENLGEYQEFLYLKQMASHEIKISPVIIIKHWYQSKKKVKVGNKYYPVPLAEYFGLFNSATKKSSPIIYKRIYTIRQNNTFYYWAIHGDYDFLNAVEEFSADVYDENLNYLRTVCVNYSLYERLGYLGGGFLLPDKPILISSEPQGESRVFLRDICWFDGSVPNVHHFEDIIIGTYINPDSTGYVMLQNERNEVYFRSVSGPDPIYDNKVFYHYEPLHNGEQYDYFIKLRDSVGLFTILNQQLEMLIDSCSQKIWVDRNNSGLQLKYLELPVIMVRKGLVYAYVQNEFKLLDASFFIAPNDLNQINLYSYVDNSGRLYSAEELEWRKQPKKGSVGKFMIAFDKRELKLTELKTSKSIVFPNVVAYRVLDGKQKLVVKTMDKKCGIIDGKTGLWYVKPIYDSISAENYANPEYLFARDKAISSTKWFGIKTDGSIVTGPEFDYPISIYKDKNYGLARSNNRWGTIDTVFNWITNPKFRNYLNVGSSLVMFEYPDKYEFMDQSTGKLFPAQHDSVNLLYPERMILFHQGKIEILDNKGKVLLPKMERSEAVKTANLAQILQGGLVRSLGQQIRIQEDLMIVMPDNKLLVKRNNENILENCRFNCLTRREILELQNKNYCDRLTKSATKRTPYRFTDNVYVEQKLGNYEHFKSKTLNACSGAYYYTGKFTNFRIVNDSLVEIKQLSELFIKDSGYELKLNALLEKVIQREQALGLVCTDMGAAIEQMKQNFIIESGKLSFVECTSKKILSVSIKDLEEYLLMKELFE